MKRSERKIQSATNWQFILGLLCAVFVAASVILVAEKINDSITIKGKSAKTGVVQKKKMSSSSNGVQMARIMANGDLLYHDLLYMSALQSDGTYDFTENYQYVKPWLKKADLVLGDFEGTIRPNYPLAGYPLFNHILDSQLEGVTTTAEAFEKQGITPIGVYTHENRDKSSLVIKKVNGIKIALLAYSYGFNGLEGNLSQADYNHHLSDLNEEKMKKEIERAEKEADITVVMPQMGVEYQLEPTEEQVTLYHKMIKWGADIIFGGHPHVVEPSEVVEQNGQKKFIIYSMGNFLSNQRIETMDGVENKKWTERGVLMDVTVEKSQKGTIIKKVQAHPSWVSRVAKGTYSPEGYPLYTYQTYILEDFIEGGKYRDKLDQVTKERIDTAYQEMNEHVNLKWDE